MVTNFTEADGGTAAEFLVIFQDEVRTSSAALQVLVEEQLDNDFVIITGTDLGNLTLAPDTVVISGQLENKLINHVYSQINLTLKSI